MLGSVNCALQNMEDGDHRSFVPSDAKTSRHPDPLWYQKTNAFSETPEDDQASRCDCINSKVSQQDSANDGYLDDEDNLTGACICDNDNDDSVLVSKGPYPIQVDPDRNDQAIEISLWSLTRPHMRAFHFAWSSFFVCFFTWFAMTPLLSEIMISLDITKQEIWISSILAIASSGLTRLITGPLNDKFGARWIMCTTLVMTGIPTGLAGLFVHSASALYWTRFAIGFAGSAFVSCQSWTSKMFAVEIAGTANALAAGWGNLGGGVAQIVMGAVLYPLFRKIYGGDSSDPLVEQQASELAWRTILVFPALMCFAMAFAVVRYSDDTPKGNVARLRREGKLQPVSAIDSLRKGASSWNTWILFIHYGLCFGTEITMTQAVSLYFKEEFGQSTASSAAIASVIGLMDLFARGLGGLASDLSNVKAGMRGRLWTQAIILLLEGALMMAFSRARTLVGAICGMILFSLFVQAAEGSTFAIVPYVDCSVTGSIAGIVGAGGNIGGICMSVMCLELEYRQAFLWMGAFAMMSSLLTCLLFVPGHRGLLGGEDSLEIQEQRRRADLPVEISLSALSQSPARDDDESL